MTGIFTITVQEARGFTAIPANIDQLAVVMGCSSAGSGLSSFFLSGASAIASVGYGDAVDTLCQAIEQQMPNGNGVKFPAAFCTTAIGVAGSYGAIDITQVVGTARPANDATIAPCGTHEAAVRIVDDGADGEGTALGTAGILYQTSLDDGRTWSRIRGLGTAYQIEIANRNVRFLLDPPAAQVTALVTFVNGIRTVALAHFPYTTSSVHGSADNASDDDVASAATDVPTGIVLTGTLIDAYESHFAMGSTVHTTADITTSLAAAVAAQAVAEATGAAQDLITVALALAAVHAAHVANTSVHGAADAVNVVSATPPTRGTLRTGDTWSARTFGPAPGSADIDAAFAVLAASTVDFRILVCDWPMTAALAARVTAGLNALRTVGKRVTALVRTRIRSFETDETEAEWIASVAANYEAFVDSRICVRAGYGFVTDAMTGNVYLRSTLQQFAADVVRSPRAQWPCAPADPVTGLSGEPNVTLIDSTGATVGHDEGPRGAVTGLSDDTLGNRFSCEMRIPESTVRENVFNTVPWVMYAADERIRNLPTRRMAHSMESVAVAAGLLQLGAKVFYTRTSPTTGVLKASSRKALQGAIYQAVAGEFGSEIDNASDASVDTGLVQVSPSITISGGNLVTVAVTLAPSIGGFVLSLDVTLAIQE